jgi:hypothetical protein
VSIYLSARRSSTLYDGLAPAVRHLPDATVVLVPLLLLAYLLPAQLIFPPLTVLGRPAVLVGFVLLVWWALSRLHPELVTRGRQPMRWVLAGYLCTVGTGYLAGQARGLSPLELNGADRTLLMALAGAGVLLAAADGVLTRERIDRVLRCLCWSTALMGLVALSQFMLRLDLTVHLKLPPVLVFKRDLIGFDARGGAGLVRVAGTAGHYIEFSVLMVIGLLLAVHYARFSATRRDRQVYAVLAILQAAVIPISLSRTGLLGLVTAILLLVLVWPLRTTFNVLAIGAMIALMIQAARPGLLSTLRALVLAGERDPSVRGRLEDYDFVTPFIRDRLWFGRGFGTWLPELYQLLDNQWLLTLVSTGVVGVAGLALLLGSGVAVAGRIRRFSRSTRDRDLATTLAVAVGVAAASAFTFDALWFSTWFLTMHLLLGLTGALWRVTRAERDNEIEA